MEARALGECEGGGMLSWCRWGACWSTTTTRFKTVSPSGRRPVALVELCFGSIADIWSDSSASICPVFLEDIHLSCLNSSTKNVQAGSSTLGARGVPTRTRGVPTRSCHDFPVQPPQPRAMARMTAVQQNHPAVGSVVLAFAESRYSL